MAEVRVVVNRWLDDHFPGFVEFVLTDADGVAHVFHQKVPVITLEDLMPTSRYPRELWIHAAVLSKDDETVTVRLAWDVSSTEDKTDFRLPLAYVRVPDAPTPA